MKTTTYRLGAAALLAALAVTGCDDAVLESGPGTIQESNAEASAGELMYLLDAQEVGARFAGGPARFEPARTWTTVDLVLHTQAPEALTWRAEFPDGTATEWTPLPTLQGEVPDVAAVLTTDRPARALGLRGPDGLEFARMEFFAERRPEGGHPGHDDDPHFAEDHEDDTAAVLDDLADKRARNGRWQVPNNGGSTYVAYTGAPSWSGGRNCSGSLTPGARELGRYLVNNFRGARSFQGYACRQIRGSSGMSVHGTGRALDIFVPLDRGQADNDLGDPIGNWLIENADEIGIQLIIWDRTIWSGSRRAGSKARYYSGAHPHHDHLHIELTPQASRRQTAFFGGNVSPPPSGGGGASAASCNSATLGRRVPDGECVQMAYERCGGTCNWARCTDGSWQCADIGNCSETYANRACAQAPAPQPEPEPEPEPEASCFSRTLGRDVPGGECVQMAYDACGGTCRWARCDDGGWSCTNRCGEEHPHAACAPQPAPTGDPCWSRTLGRNVPDSEYVQMAYDACGGRCRYARCDDGGWTCAQPGGGDTRHPHAQCR